jgi:hypothetical protein
MSQPTEGQPQPQPQPQNPLQIPHPQVNPATPLRTTKLSPKTVLAIEDVLFTVIEVGLSLVVVAIAKISDEWIAPLAVSFSIIKNLIQRLR